jgi:hypothetical protein
MKLVILDDSHVGRGRHPLAEAAALSEVFLGGVALLEGRELRQNTFLTAHDFTRGVVEPALKNAEDDGDAALVLDLNIHGRLWFGRDVLRTLRDDEELPLIVIAYSANISTEIRTELEDFVPAIEVFNRYSVPYDKVLRRLVALRAQLNP